MNLADNTMYMRLRFRYWDGEATKYVFSDWSEVFSVGDSIDAKDTAASDKAANGQIDSAAPSQDDKCPLCGFCMMPLGLCVFIWIAIILAVTAIIVVVVLTRKKKCPGCGAKHKRKAAVCPKCGHKLK